MRFPFAIALLVSVLGPSLATSASTAEEASKKNHVTLEDKAIEFNQEASHDTTVNVDADG